MTRNLTAGHPAKVIFLFTIPLLIGNLFQQLYSMADTLIVGRTISVNALAAVGCTGSIVFLIIGFAQGVTSGFSIITAQRFGAGDEPAVRRSFAVSIVLSAAVTSILMIISIISARPMLELMRTPPEIMEDAYSYIIVIYFGIFACVLFNLLFNVIRSLGDSRTPLVFLVAACILNIMLDFVFILSFHMGVAGAAWATILAQLVSGGLCILFIIKKFPVLMLSKADWRITKDDIWSHIRVGLPMGFQSSIIAIGAILLQAALNNLGATSVAAYTAASKIDQFATMPMMSFGMSMATFAAQNYGAKDFGRIRQGVRQCCMMSVAFSVVIGIVNILFGRYLTGVFVGAEPEVEALAQIFLNINGAMYFVLALLFVYRYTLQGLGQSMIPTIAGVVELCMRTFAAVVLAQYIGFAGACLANPFAWIGACVPLGIAYYRLIKKISAQEIPADTADSIGKALSEETAANAHTT